MRTNGRQSKAAVVGLAALTPLVGVTVMLLATELYYEFRGPARDMPFELRSLFEFLVAAYAVAFVAFLVGGIPLHILLRLLRISRLSTYVAAGAAVGALASVWFYSPGSRLDNVPFSSAGGVGSAAFFWHWFVRRSRARSNHALHAPGAGAGRR